MARPIRRRSRARTSPGALLPDGQDMLTLAAGLDGMATASALVGGSTSGIEVWADELGVVDEPELAPRPQRTQPLKIAMIGQRGVPASFGGVEVHVEEIGRRLAELGHEVVVFSRNNYSPADLDSYKGMTVRRLPTVGTKHLDAIAHSALSTLAAWGQAYDIVHYHAIGPGIPACFPRLLSRAKVVLTVHGLDGQRAKWGLGARSILTTAEWMSARVPNATIVVSESLGEHYAEKHGRATHRIANGVNEQIGLPPNEITTRWGLTKGDYVLFVGRLVPEKAPDMLIRAFKGIDTDKKLVVVGGSSYTTDFVRSVHESGAADDRVILPGYLFGDTLNELYANAAAFVLPSSLEGLPLTLLEAASYGTPIVASDIPPHVEVIGAGGPGARLFASGSEGALSAALTLALQDPSTERAGAAGFKHRVLEKYSWDRAVAETERVYYSLLDR